MSADATLFRLRAIMWPWRRHNHGRCRRNIVCLAFDLRRFNHAPLERPSNQLTGCRMSTILSKHSGRVQATTTRIALFAVALISFVPFFLSLLTWSVDGLMTRAQILIRVLSLVAVFAEILVLLVAIRRGFVFRDVHDATPPRLRIVAGVWISVAMLAVVIGGADNLIFSAIITARYGLQIVTIFALIFLLRSEPQFSAIHWFLWMTAGQMAYLAALTFFIVAIPHPKDFSWLGGLPSATSIRHIANYLSIMCLAPISVFLFAQGHKKHYLLVCIALTGMFVAWSGSRASLIGIGAAVVVAVFVLRRHLRKDRVVVLVSAVSLGALSSLALPTPDSGFGLIHFVDDGVMKVDVSSGRFEMWQRTASAIFEQPLFGHGAGRFYDNMSRLYGYDLDNPHNFILQYGYDWGLIGVSSGLLLIFVVGIHALRKANTSPMTGFAGVAGYTMLVTIGLLEGMLYHPLKMLLITAIMLPLLAVKAQPNSLNPMTT